MTDDELEWLLSLDGLTYQSSNYIVEYSIKRIHTNKHRPHGISYALVLRPVAGGEPWVRFDNAHGVKH